MDTSEMPTITRADLAATLGFSSDPLAVFARDSLALSEAPESLPVSASVRSDLLATYELRLARAEHGEGPATRQLHEYTETLRSAGTPDTLDEIGWAVGDTFYVALLHNRDVIAMTTVARAVWYLDDRMTHLDRNTFLWVDIKTFGIGTGFNDVTLIKNTLDQRAYADSYQEAPPEEQSGGVHGPYLLKAIDPADFTPVSARGARSVIRTWADQDGVQSRATQVALALNV